MSEETVEIVRRAHVVFQDGSSRGNGRVVVMSLQRATGKASGVPVELRMGGIWTVEGGQVTRVENFLEPADALRAAGLSE